MIFPKTFNHSTSYFYTPKLALESFQRLLG